MIVQSNPIAPYMMSKTFADITLTLSAPSISITSVNLFERHFLFAQILTQCVFANNSPPLYRQIETIACSHPIIMQRPV